MSSPVPGALLVGAPRSGTSWLQRLIGAHPAVATSQEIDFLTAYIVPWLHRWDTQLVKTPDRWRRNRHKGLPAIMTATEFKELLRSAIATVYGSILSLKDGSIVVLDKAPGYALRLRTILEVLPDIPVIHIIRDGRDVAASLMRAGRSWGRGWASEDLGRSATVWADHVASVQSLGMPSRQLYEVRYEALLGDTETELSKCFDFLRLPWEPEQVAEIVSRIAGTSEGAASGPRADSLLWAGEVVKQLGGPPEEPEGFFGEGGSGNWRGQWSGYERWLFDRIAGELLVGLGYENDDRWAASSGPEIGFVLRRRATRAVARVQLVPDAMSRARLYFERSRPAR